VGKEARESPENCFLPFSSGGLAHSTTNELGLLIELLVHVGVPKEIMKIKIANLLG
jgi:hypothetical protein